MVAINQVWKLLTGSGFKPVTVDISVLWITELPQAPQAVHKCLNWYNLHQTYIQFPWSVIKICTLRWLSWTQSLSQTHKYTKKGSDNLSICQVNVCSFKLSDPLEKTSNTPPPPPKKKTGVWFVNWYICVDSNCWSQNGGAVLISLT